MQPGTPPEARGRSTAWIVQLALLCVALAAASLISRSPADLPDYPLTEDGYYALSVARHMAAGNGLTADGATWTNGFQPLFTFLCVPAYQLSGGERLAGLRWVLALHWLVWLGTALLIGAILRDAVPRGPRERRLAFWLGALLYAGAFSAFIQHFNGLETGLVLFLLALVWRVWQLRPCHSLSRSAFLGALLGLLFLARIDSVFLVIGLCLYGLFFERALDLAARLRRFVVMGGTSLLVASPWLLYSLIGFGSIMPSSGTAQQQLVITWRKILMAKDMGLRDSMPWVYLPFTGEVLLRQLVVIAVVVALVLLLRRAHRSLPAEALSKLRRSVEPGALILASSLILIFWYTASSFAIYHYWRYFAPLLVPFTFAVGFCLVALCSRRWMLVPLVSVLIALPVVRAGLDMRSGELPWRVRRFENVFLSKQLPLVEAHVPARERVAAMSSGTLGYFRDDVVNLDGKVNAATLVYRERRWEYLEEQDIRWFCDLKEYVPRALGERPEEHGWELFEEAGAFQLYRRTDS